MCIISKNNNSQQTRKENTKYYPVLDQLSRQIMLVSVLNEIGLGLAIRLHHLFMPPLCLPFFGHQTASHSNPSNLGKQHHLNAILCVFAQQF